MSRSLMGLCFSFMAATSSFLYAGDSCFKCFDISCKDRSACEDSYCEDSCDEGCHRRKCLDIGLRIPSIRWGISLGCDGACSGGCHHCQLCKKKCWWRPPEPPRAPLVFSVPAVTVPQQALAIQPVQPQFAAPAVAPQASQTCKPQQLSTTDKLLLEALLRQLQSGESQSRSQSGSRSQAAPSAALDEATEARLTQLENRLDRILQLLEK